MLQKNYPKLLLLILLALLLAGCELSAGGSEEAPPSPEALFTAAAQTAEAMRLQRFGLTPSPPAAEALIATAAAVTPTPTLVVTATLPAPATATSAPAASSGDKAEYVADVTIPDGTVFAPGESFQKTWRITNTGITTWTTAYELVYIDGNLLGAAASVPLPDEVAPDEQIDITVDMVAPDTPGDYTSYWKLRTSQGGLFGFGSAASEAIWVKISVSATGGEAVAATEESTSGETVTGVTLTVDSGEVTGQCPHTFLLTAEITLSKPATVSYVLEAGGVAGSTLRVPPLAQRNFEAGVHSVVFELTIPTTTVGWARVRISAPEALVSNQANFSLTCAP